VIDTVKGNKMYSVIVSMIDSTKFEKILLPSLHRVRQYLADKKLPDLQIIAVSGTEALTKNYNEGLKKAQYRIKFFIHDDINIMDNADTTVLPLFVKIENLFNNFPKTGLIGLAGTTGLSNGWWWETPREAIVGHVYMGGNVNQYWKWAADKEFYSNVNFIDGMFMSTQLDIPFSEDIVGFHLYDSDYSNLIRQAGYEIKVINHLVNHDWINKEFYTDFTHYRKKWKLSDEMLRDY